MHQILHVLSYAVNMVAAKRKKKHTKSKKRGKAGKTRLKLAKKSRGVAKAKTKIARKTKKRRRKTPKKGSGSGISTTPTPRKYRIPKTTKVKSSRSYLYAGPPTAISLTAPGGEPYLGAHTHM